MYQMYAVVYRIDVSIQCDMTCLEYKLQKENTVDCNSPKQFECKNYQRELPLWLKYKFSSVGNYYNNYRKK